MLRIIIYTFYCLADTSIATRFVKTDFHLHTLARMLGGVLNQGHRFVSFVRAYARSGCLVTLNLNLCWWSFSLFSFGFGELSLSCVVLRSFPFSLPPPPNLLSNFSSAYRSKISVNLAPARTRTPQAGIIPPFKGVVLTHARKDYVEPLQLNMVPMPFATAKIGALKCTTATTPTASILKRCADNRGKVVCDSCSFEVVRGSMDILRVNDVDG